MGNYLTHIKLGGFNYSDAFSLSSAGSDSAWGATIDSDGSDIWIADNTDNFVYHFNTTAPDSCSCPAINTNWNVNLAHYCIINSACDIGSGNITFTGVGNFTCNATINASNLDDHGSNSILYINSLCRMNIG